MPTVRRDIELCQAFAMTSGQDSRLRNRRLDPKGGNLLTSIL